MKSIKILDCILSIVFGLCMFTLGIVVYNLIDDWINETRIGIILILLDILLMIVVIVINGNYSDLSKIIDQANQKINTAISNLQNQPNSVTEKEIALSKKYHLAETYLQEVLHPIACSSGYAEVNTNNKYIELRKREVLAEASKPLASILNIEISAADVDNAEKLPVDQLEEEIKKMDEQLNQLDDTQEKNKLTNELNELKNKQKELKLKQAQKLLKELNVKQKQVENELTEQQKQVENELTEQLKQLG